MEILKNIIPDIITKVWLTGVGAIIVSRVTKFTNYTRTSFTLLL